MIGMVIHLNLDRIMLKFIILTLCKILRLLKKRTNGVIHQHVKVKVDEWNQDYVKSRCKAFDFTKHTKSINDKRCKSGKKENYYYKYTYYGKEYNLKELNKHGVHITKDIHFNTILDLIPYFPYIVTASVYNGDTYIVVISSENYVEKCFKEHNWDLSDAMCDRYRKNLAKFTQEIVLNYLSDYKERTIEQDFKVEKENDKYIIHLEKPVDYNFETKLITNGEPIWSSLKLIDDYTLDVSKTFFDIDKRPVVRIKYVYKGERKLWLR